MGRIGAESGGNGMRAVIQRVNYASVSVDGEIVGKINKGLAVLLGVSDEDDETDAKYLFDKITNLRVFEDENGKMNISLSDIQGELLIISQFTLFGDCRKGRRPSFDKAGKPEHAKQLYEYFIQLCRDGGFVTQNGIFGADMKVALENDGPVTLLTDSKKLF